ncbi:hypothetical protein EBR25_02075 [bacterium]|nr:hypothetical protein [bacterium]
MGMAMAGMLDAPGRETRRKANFFDENTGALFGNINSSEARLHNQYGFTPVRGEYLARTDPKETGFRGDKGFTRYLNPMNQMAQHQAEANAEKITRNTERMLPEEYQKK